MTATRRASELTGGDPNISGPLDVSAQKRNATLQARAAFMGTAQDLDASFYPSGYRSLSAIALHAFLIGTVLGISVLLTTFFLLPPNEHPIWRLPAFLATLSIFHFLEFWTTARYNTPVVKVSSFLLFSNGAAYNVAHSCAMLEILVTSFLTPRAWIDVLPLWVRLVGFALVLLGQTVRSIAMAQAGRNFNHVPAQQKVEGHRLVSHGVYAWFRHPSYFGFFWWAIGTQLLVGNMVCSVGYTIVLWVFFDKRIVGEEKNLVEFFGKEYEDYRKRTGTMIPFIR